MLSRLRVLSVLHNIQHPHHGFNYTEPTVTSSRRSYYSFSTSFSFQKAARGSLDASRRSAAYLLSPLEMHPAF